MKEEICERQTSKTESKALRQIRVAKLSSPVRPIFQQTQMFVARQDARIMAMASQRLA
jgi:hypothetical protein